jgi:hypothetical protein
MLTLLVAGCSSFNREWRQAYQAPAPLDSLEGRWEGRWSSDANGHNGNLRCLITRKKDGDYAAWFRATYMRVLHFSYTVSLQAESRDGIWQFRGEEDLGKLSGGIYRYVGSATEANFHSTYQSEYDHGIFELKRRPAGKKTGRQ